MLCGLREAVCVVCVCCVWCVHPGVECEEMELEEGRPLSECVV